jgi:hypothetical protein
MPPSYAVPSMVSATSHHNVTGKALPRAGWSRIRYRLLGERSFLESGLHLALSTFLDEELLLEPDCLILLHLDHFVSTPEAVSAVLFRVYFTKLQV